MTSLVIFGEDFLRYSFRRFACLGPVTARVTLLTIGGNSYPRCSGGAIDCGLMRSNPARKVRRPRYATSGFHAWTIDEIRQFETPQPRPPRFPSVSRSGSSKAHTRAPRSWTKGQLAVSRKDNFRCRELALASVATGGISDEIKTTSPGASATC